MIGKRGGSNNKRLKEELKNSDNNRPQKRKNSKHSVRLSKRQLSKKSKD